MGGDDLPPGVVAHRLEADGREFALRRSSMARLGQVLAPTMLERATTNTADASRVGGAESEPGYRGHAGPDRPKEAPYMIRDYS